MGICEGRVVIVTGAGRGIGREHALELARQGARVVVNDLGAGLHGEGGELGPAESVVAEIEALGGEAIVNGEDVADWDGAGRMIAAAVERFGRLDALVNNAGILRDRMFANMSEQEWDDVIRVHLKGHFCPTKHAVAYWRDQKKAGADVRARIINTSSNSGLQGSVGQANYGAAKAGIAALTLIQAAELRRYGVTANAIAPAARTRMTEELFADMMAKPEAGFDPWAADNISPLVAWLASDDSEDVTGCVFEVQGGRISLCDGWRTGPTAERGARWDSAEVGSAVRGLIAEAVPPQKVFGT